MFLFPTNIVNGGYSIGLSLLGYGFWWLTMFVQADPFGFWIGIWVQSSLFGWLTSKLCHLLLYNVPRINWSNAMKWPIFSEVSLWIVQCAHALDLFLVLFSHVCSRVLGFGARMSVAPSFGITKRRVVCINGLSGLSIFCLRCWCLPSLV